MNIKSIIEENEIRKKTLFPNYNPITGEGSLVPRKEFVFNVKGEDIKLHLPEKMFDMAIVQELNHNSIDNVIKQVGLSANDESRNALIKDFINTRLDYDFEFFAATAVRIQDKETKQPIPFVLNAAQRKLLAVLISMFNSGVPMRIILLKARQWGGSTLVQIFMAWIQIRILTNWHSVVVADVEEQSRNIRGMYSKLLKYYPSDLGMLTFSPFEGSVKTRLLNERGCIIGVGSAQKPENLRSFDFSMAHLSEIGLWQSTLKRSAEDLVQSIANTIPFSSNTLIAKESTAKGVGNYFHREWIAAKEGKSAYRPVFISWFEIERYLLPIDNKEKFINTWNDYDLWQWEQGATLEGINWYKNYKASENYDDWRMKSEMPTTDVEAFQSTGRRVFHPLYVQRARKTCEKPLMVGDLMGKGIMGKESLIDIQFVPNDRGCLKVWSEPDHSVKMKNRYCLFADIGGRSEGADFSTIKVIDRYWMMYNDRPEVCAVWHGHLDQDLFAWKAAQLGMWYFGELLAIEVNSLRSKGEDTEGDHTLTILDEIAEVYPNLYARTTPDRIRQGLPAKWGFHTNKASKTMIIDTLNGALRDESYVEKDSLACDEMDCYEYKPDGSMGAVEGQKDDRAVTTAGCVWLAIKHMELPEEVVIIETKGKGIVSEASF